MGWLVMYVAVFMLMASAMINHQVERRDQAEEVESQAIAWHMAAWHRAAVGVCYDPIETACQTAQRIPDETVRNHLGIFVSDKGVKYQFDSLKDASAFKGRYVSLVDPPNRTVVTYYRIDGSMKKRDAAPIAAGLTYDQGWTAIMGLYDAGRGRIDRTGNLPDTDPSVVRTKIHSPIGGEVVPDGAPVIVTRY